jgi:ABC-type nickel/cobalt efflux system permease component RcnA
MRRVPTQRDRAFADRMMWLPRFSVLLLLLVALQLVGAEIREVTIDILSPIHGTVVDASNPNGLALHVKVTGLSIPDDGYAQLLLDDQLIANMEEPEVYLVMEAAANLPQGAHKLTVQLMDAAGVPLGAEKSSEFSLVPGRSRDSESRVPQGMKDRGARGTVVSDPSEGGRGGHKSTHKGGRFQAPSWGGGGVAGGWGVGGGDVGVEDVEGEGLALAGEGGGPCELDLRQTFAAGPGLQNASAGMSLHFQISQPSADNTHTHTHTHRHTHTHTHMSRNEFAL